MSKKQYGISVYRQIADILTLRIKQGIYKPGDRLPSDRDLSDEFDHNRHTVRRALDILADNNLIERYPGKGTFVVDAIDTQDNRTSLKLGLIDLAREMGQRPRATVLNTDVQTIDNASDSSTVPIKGNYYIVHRLRIRDDEPLIIETIHIPISIAPKLFEYDLTSSLRELLQDVYNIQGVRVDISIESILSDVYTSKLLKIPIGSPLILEKRLAYTDTDDICEYSEHIYRGDRFIFNQEFNSKE